MLARALPRLSHGQKIALLAAAPMILAITAIGLLLAVQSKASATREIAALEAQILDAKREELRNHVSLARGGLYEVYGDAPPDDPAIKQQVRQSLAAMTHGEEGFFFVYDFDGTNLVSPRQTGRVGRNWSGLTDSAGTPVVDELIGIARQGAGYHEYLWPRPSGGQEARMIAYVTSFPSWGWAVGTGVFIDDALASAAAAAARTQRMFLLIALIASAALLAVFASGLLINARERRLADAKLKRLTQRVFDAQEEERGRVARELHDGISQMLVGVRYALDSARRKLGPGNPETARSLDRGADALATAISEVRRISRDLRPGVLDDLGLGPALKTLVEDFAERTGIETEFTTVVFRNRLDQEAKIALYRIAQEALTNVERHAQASAVQIDLRGHRQGATLRIADNGTGLDLGRPQAKTGIGLRNMEERAAQLDGTLRILPQQGTASGTVIEVTIPLTHILPPEPATPGKRAGAEA